MSAIDLGDELADYSEDRTPKKPTWAAPGGMGSHGRLADLQAQGFNRTPDHPLQVPPMWGGLDPVAVAEIRCKQCQRYLPGATVYSARGYTVDTFCADCERMQRR